MCVFGKKKEGKILNNEKYIECILNYTRVMGTLETSFGWCILVAESLLPYSIVVRKDHFLLNFKSSFSI